MRVDLTMVLYRPDMAELGRTLDSLAEDPDQFGLLWLLLSGSDDQRRQLEELLVSAGLAEVCRVTHRFDNIGFASGHNRLLAQAFGDGADAALVLNPDTRVAPDALRELADAVEADDRVALYGPTILRAGTDATVADSMGIGWTADGRHFDVGQGELARVDAGLIVTVDGVTGACLFVPERTYAKLLRDTGWFFDDTFIAYREDAELGVRASLVGVPSRLVHLEGFEHVRSVRGFTRGATLPDLLGVRNRLLIRHRLGRHRPGRWGLDRFRDAIVTAAVYLQERSSLPGLRQARAIRRFSTQTSSTRGRVRVGDAPLRVLYLGIEDPTYPRNARIRRFLEEEIGADVTIVGIDKGPGAIRKAAILIRQGLRPARGSFQVVILGEFQVKYGLIAKLVARYHGARLVVDWFVGLYETRVEDWEMARPGSPRARVWRWLDQSAARAGDVVLTDTDERAKMLVADFGVSPERVTVLPVGAPSWARPAPLAERHGGTLRVLYYGGYLPLHGVPYILRSIARARSVLRIEAVFIGGGERRAAAESLSRELGLVDRVQFVDSVPEAQLAGEIAKADVVLGVFGSSPKASSVIANKVWQGLSSGRVVITRESKALSEISGLVPGLLVTVDPEEGQALADALDAIGEEPTGICDPSARLEAYVAERYGRLAVQLSSGESP